MPRNARKMDQVKIENCAPGKCKRCSHGPQIGQIMTPCATTTQDEGPQAARITDNGPVFCPHGGTFIIVKTCSNTYIDGLLVARIGDMVQCTLCGSPGQIIGSASKTDTTK